MKRAGSDTLLLIAVCAAACSASHRASDESARDSGPVADSEDSGVDSSVGVDFGFGDGPGAADAGVSQVNCQLEPKEFPEFDRSCDDASDCAAVRQVVDCCGNSNITAVRGTAAADFIRADQLCATQLVNSDPLCDCPFPGPPARADDGTIDTGGLAIKLSCVDHKCRSGFVDEPTPCGPDGLLCETRTEICIGTSPDGVRDIAYSCERAGTCLQRNCDCVSPCPTEATICSSNTRNTVICGCDGC